METIYKLEEKKKQFNNQFKRKSYLNDITLYPHCTMFEKWMDE